MIQKKNLFFPSLARFLLKKISANATNTAYVTGSLDGEAVVGEPDVMWQSVVFIADTHQIWTNGTLFGGGSSDSDRFLYFEIDNSTGCLMMIEVNMDDSMDFMIDSNGNLNLTLE